MGDRVLVLKAVSEDMTSRNGFQYPTKGMVEALDWDGGKDVCGGGLHGFLWGCGNGDLANWNKLAKWLVILVDLADGLVGLTADGGGKCKFRRGVVVYCGDLAGAVAYLDSNGAADKPVIGAVRVVGDRGIAAAGYRGTATAGDGGIATVGDHGTVKAGDYGTATAGDYGTATAGDYGTATAGDFGTATAGDYGTATAGYRGTVMAGRHGTISLRFWDGDRRRIATRCVDDGGVKPNTPYNWDKVAGEVVEVL